jgi:energy-coupling factor transporter ATP-binding protein EcfA2
MYEHPSTAKTLKTIKQKHDKSLQNYAKHFCNTRNAILYTQDIEIINAFCDRVIDIKIAKEIAMTQPRTVADLLAIADVCIEASEARAWLLESCGKDPRRRSKTIGRSTQPIMEIAEIADIAEIVSSNPQTRRRK